MPVSRLIDDSTWKIARKPLPRSSLPRNPSWEELLEMPNWPGMLALSGPLPRGRVAPLSAGPKIVGAPLMLLTPMGTTLGSTACAYSRSALNIP